MPSVIVLQSRVPEGGAPIQLPIRIGPVEAVSFAGFTGMAISMGLDPAGRERPMTHDLLSNVIKTLGATVTGVAIVDVHGTTFYAEVMLTTDMGRFVKVDSRPSDAIALAVRVGAPIYADDQVLDAATMPDFRGVEKEEKQQELERFHDFVESLSPADFAQEE